jgi:hypothetical protein
MVNLGGTVRDGFVPERNRCGSLTDKARSER